MPTPFKPESPTPTYLRLSLQPHGLHPGLLDISPDKRLLVVPCQDSHNILIVSTESLTVQKVIPLRDKCSPWMALITQDGKRAFVSLSDYVDKAPSPTSNSTIAVVNMERLEIEREIKVGAGPNGMVIDYPHTNLLVANSRSGSVSVVSLESWESVKEIKVGRSPFSITIAPEHRYAIVCNFEDASLSVIDLVSLSVIKTLVVGTPTLKEPNPEWGQGDTTWFSVGAEDKGYACNWRSHEIVELDLASLTITKRIQSPIKNPFEAKWRRDSNHLVVASDIDKRVGYLNPVTESLDGEIHIHSPTFQPGPTAMRNVLLSDPNNHSILFYAPLGLGNIAKFEGPDKQL